ncbi:MAG: glycosyltransferase family 4 protein [Candidatus Hodarchaeota archaeon]
MSNFVRDVHINHLKLPASKVFRIPNFFDVKEHSEINYENELPGDFILYIGALVPHKGLDFLVDAIFNEKFGIPIVILGPKHVAYDYSKYSDLNRIVVLENPPRSLVLAALARCRFLVVPSLCADACPLVVLEAMKHAKAVIASRIGGIPDIILEGETGLLIPPGDVPSLIKSMKWMLENKNICEKMGDRGRQQFLQNFTAEKITQKIEKIYLNVIGA